jgi:hypothetical protein
MKLFYWSIESWTTHHYSSSTAGQTSGYRGQLAPFEKKLI